MSAWLESLKAGDEVMVPSRYGAPSILRVDRVTPTQVVVGSEKYRKSNGYRVGGSTWDCRYITEPTDHGREQAEAALLRSNLERLVKDQATTLEALRAMYKATKP
jgi:hypothetical protein